MKIKLGKFFKDNQEPIIIVKDPDNLLLVKNEDKN